MLKAVKDVSPLDPRATIEQFIDFLYEGLEGYVYAPTADRDSTGARLNWTQNFYQYPQQRRGLVDWILSVQESSDVYVAPAIFSEPTGQKSAYKASNVVWAEFDGNAATVSEQSASLTIQSSAPGHEHWYWKLDSPVGDVNELESVNRALAYNLKADTSGWDANQVLRIPGTFNHKRKLPVYILEQGNSTHSFSEFGHLSEISVPTSSLFDVNVIPDVSDVILKYAFNDQFIQTFRRPVSEIPTGGRSSHLMSLGYLAAEHGLSNPEIYALIRNADDRIGKFKDRTDRERRLTDLINLVRQRVPADSSVATDAPILVMGVRSLLASDIEIEWAITGLLQAQGYMLLTGQSGVGKTQVSLRFAIALASGSSFIGHDVQLPQRVLFVSCEMGHADIKYFIDIMCRNFTEEQLDLLEENLLVVPYGEPIPLDTPNGQKLIENLLTDYQPDGLMFDSIGSGLQGDISAEAPVRTFMEWNDKVRKRFNLWTWFIHHNRKASADNRKPNRMDDIYGNQYIVNRATSVYMLYPVGLDIEVIPIKLRLSSKPDPFRIARIPQTLDFIRRESALTSIGFGDNMLSPEQELVNALTKPTTLTDDLGLGSSPAEVEPESQPQHVVTPKSLGLGL